MNPKDIETRNCKTPNCPNETTTLRGRYAGLCDYCRSVQVDGDRANGTTTLGRPLTPPPPPRAESAPESFEARAKQLVRFGKSLDTAVARFKPAKHALEQAMAEWKAAVRELAGDES